MVPHNTAWYCMAPHGGYNHCTDNLGKVYKEAHGLAEKGDYKEAHFRLIDPVS